MGNGESRENPQTVLESRFRRTPDSRLPTPQPHKKYAMFYTQQLNRPGSLLRLLMVWKVIAASAGSGSIM
jgi:hypothetical protein